MKTKIIKTIATIEICKDGNLKCTVYLDKLNNGKYCISHDTSLNIKILDDLKMAKKMMENYAKIYNTEVEYKSIANNNYK